MRCSCEKCGTYMIQADDLTLGCKCPNCFNRCTACLGTNTVISREDLKKLENDPRVLFDPFKRGADEPDEEGAFSGEDGFEDYRD